VNAFREKLLTIQVSPQVKQPSARKNYWDQGLLDQHFEGGKERMLDDTGGLGAAYPDGRGGFVDAEGEQVDSEHYLEGEEYDVG
jgi:hypothetical protein